MFLITKFLSGFRRKEKCKVVSPGFVIKFNRDRIEKLGGCC